VQLKCLLVQVLGWRMKAGLIKQDVLYKIEFFLLLEGKYIYACIFKVYTIIIGFFFKYIMPKFDHMSIKYMITRKLSILLWEELWPENPKHFMSARVLIELYT